MQTIEAGALKRGQVLLLEGVPYAVEEAHGVGTAQTRRKVHTRLRNMLKGLHVERVFAEDERVPLAEMEQRNVQFSYVDGNRYVFLDTETYDELALDADRVGERRWFLKENEEYRALFLEGVLLDIVLPDNLPMRVVSTAPPQKGGSDATWKPATLEGGLEIMVPLFIAPGETVRVDTQTRKYLRKESGE